MNLAHGGHLTHGHPLNFSGMMYKVVAYGVKRDTETIDYDEMHSLARQHRPKLIVAGASAYSRQIDFSRFRAAADDVGAMVMADIAHIAGPVAAGLHNSPIPSADFVTTTTHKTLRGPRGGVVFCKTQHAKALDRITFPGLQGGPLVHVIAAKAVCFQEALQPSFKDYQRQVLENAKTLAATLAAEGFRIVSGGTDNHLFLLDVAAAGLSGKEAEVALERAHITVNKNAIPFDTRPPVDPSGIRIGSPAVTTRGMGPAQMQMIGSWIARVLKGAQSPQADRVIGEVGREVRQLCLGHPLPYRAIGTESLRGMI
jgi:glycine hydroxymethyltransferase